MKYSLYETNECFATSCLFRIVFHIPINELVLSIYGVLKSCERGRENEAGGLRRK